MLFTYKCYRCEAKSIECMKTSFAYSETFFYDMQSKRNVKWPCGYFFLRSVKIFISRVREK